MIFRKFDDNMSISFGDIVRKPTNSRKWQLVHGGHLVFWILTKINQNLPLNMIFWKIGDNMSISFGDILRKPTNSKNWQFVHGGHLVFWILTKINPSLPLPLNMMFWKFGDNMSISFEDIERKPTNSKIWHFCPWRPSCFLDFDQNRPEPSLAPRYNILKVWWQYVI